MLMDFVGLAHQILWFNPQQSLGLAQVLELLSFLSSCFFQLCINQTLPLTKIPKFSELTEVWNASTILQLTLRCSISWHLLLSSFFFVLLYGPSFLEIHLVELKKLPVWISMFAPFFFLVLSCG